MSKIKSQKIQSVNKETMIVTLDIGKGSHYGYFRAPDGQDVVKWGRTKLNKGKAQGAGLKAQGNLDYMAALSLVVIGEGHQKRRAQIGNFQ